MDFRILSALVVSLKVTLSDCCTENSLLCDLCEVMKALLFKCKRRVQVQIYF